MLTTTDSVPPPSGRRRRTRHTWRVLLAEHEARARRALAGLLRREECHVVEARSSDDFLDLLVDASLPDEAVRDSYDVIITDLVMPGAGGLRALRAFGKPLSTIPVVFISTVVDAELERRMGLVGAIAVLQKPFGQGQVQRALGAALHVGQRRSAR